MSNKDKLAAKRYNGHVPGMPSGSRKREMLESYDRNIIRPHEPLEEARRAAGHLAFLANEIADTPLNSVANLREILKLMVETYPVMGVLSRDIREFLREVGEEP